MNIKRCLALVLALSAGFTTAFAQSSIQYSLPHGSLAAGEANIISNGGGKFFYPASVSGTLISSPTGAQVKTDFVDNGTVNAGLSVRSTLTVAPRSGLSSVYISPVKEVYLVDYETFKADGSNNTSVASLPVLLDEAKYPELKDATKVFASYTGPSQSASYYLSGTNLYRTTALKPGTANSSTATLVESTVSGVVGVDSGVFVLTASGVVFHSVSGNSYGLSSIISPSVTLAQFNSITAASNDYYVMLDESGNHLLFKEDGSYNISITGINKVGFVPYYSRSAQVAGHNGQTAFAWYTADYKLSYIDPYASEASAIMSIEWNASTGTKSTRANTYRFLSISEDGFVTYTGKNAAGSSHYLHVAANFATMAAVNTTTTTSAAEALSATSASVAWNNPTNVNWHYKVAPATLNNAGTKTYFWKWYRNNGKVVLTRTTTSNAVKSYTGGGRICRLASQYYVVPPTPTVTGTGTGTSSSPYSGPANPCGSPTITLAQADAADLANSSQVPVGAADASYIDAAGFYVRSGSMTDLSTTGTPGSVSGTANTPNEFSSISGWDSRHSLLFGLNGSGTPFVGGWVFDSTTGSSKFINFPFANNFLASSSLAASQSSVTLNWNDPRDPKAGVSTWNVTTSRLVGSTPTDSLTQSGSPSTRTLTINPVTAGYSQNYTASAELTVPVIGHRGAKYTVTSPQFVGTVDQPPTLTIGGTVQLASNSANFEIPAAIADPDEGDVLTLTVTSAPSKGSIAINSGKYFYTPNANYIGTDAFTAQVTDLAGASAVLTINLNITCPVPVISGLTLATSQNGPYLGTTATLAYSSNACNSGLPTTFSLKDGNGNTIAGTAQSLTLVDGASKTQSYVFTDIAPGIYSVNARIQSTVNTGFLSDTVASQSYTSGTTTPPTLTSNKTTPTEDDDIILSASTLPLCAYYDSVSSARTNRGCFIEWTTGAGIISATPLSTNQIKLIGLRGTQNIQAVVRAYNTDGSNFALNAVNFPLTIAAPVDVLLNRTFSKGGSYAQYMDKFAVTLTGDGSNLCQVVATDAQAQSIVDAAGKACLVEFTQLPSGVKQEVGSLQLSGRLLSASLNTVDYKTYRYYGPGSKSFINNGSFPVLTSATSFTAATAILPVSVNGLPGYSVALNVSHGVTCVQTSGVVDAKASWVGDGAPKCLTTWTSIPAGLAPSVVAGQPGISGQPTSSVNQLVSFKVFLVDENDAQIEVAAATDLKVDSAPNLLAPVTPVQIDTNSNEAVIAGVSFGDDDAGDTAQLELLTAPQNGIASIANGQVKYKPAPAYVGADVFTLKATDTFGVSKTASVNVDVVCGMPSIGGVVSPNAMGIWDGQPVSIRGSYSPAHLCHTNITTSLEILNGGGSVVRTIATPSSMDSSVDGNGYRQNNPVFSNVSLTPGTYTTRLRVTSVTAGKEVVINGDQIIVIPAIAATLSSNKTTPTEDDDVVVTATALPLCQYFSSVGAARVGQGCFIEWSGTSGVMSVVPTSANTATVIATEGSQTVTAIIRAYNTDGSYFELPEASVSMSVSKAIDVGVVATFSKSGSYKQYFDNVSASFASAPGSLCALNATEQQAQVMVDAGNHACLLEFVTMPNGMTAITDSLNINGRIVNASNNNIGYKVARYYKPGVKKQINTGEVVIQAAPFAPVVSSSIKAEDYTGVKGYSVVNNIVKDEWTCVQTTATADAKASWTQAGGPKCLVEWQLIPAGLAQTTVSGSPGIAGIPTVLGDQKSSYTISVIDSKDQKYTIDSAVDLTVDAAPIINVASIFEIDTNSIATPIPGISSSDPDAGDVSELSVDTVAQHGSVTLLGNEFSYKPGLSFVGSDSFAIKATDKFGVSSKKVVLIDVLCGMPTSGAVTTPNISGFWEIKPQSVSARFSPEHGCHAGYQASLQLLNTEGQVVSAISAPTSQGSTTVNEIAQRDLVYSNISFQSGTYTTRLKIKSNAFPSKEIFINGDTFAVLKVPSPTLTSDKATPSEDDVVAVSAAHTGCTKFEATPAQAVTNGTCYLDWSKSGSITSITRTSETQANVVAKRGSGSVRGTIQIPDSSGILRDAAFADLSLTFQTGTATPIIAANFSKESFIQIVDHVAGGLTVESGGYNCQLVGSIASGTAVAISGGNACLINYTNIPTGMRILAGGVSFAGRVIDINNKTFNYSLSRVYDDSTTAPLPGGQFTIPMTAMDLKASVQTSRIAYAAGIQDALVSLKIVDVSQSSISCEQTSFELDASASWNNTGIPKCHVSWTSIPNGLSLDAVNRLTLTGKPIALTGNEIAYVVSFIDNLGNKYVAFNGTSTLIVRSPISPSFTVIAKNGMFTPSDNSDPYYLIGDDGVIGLATITGGDFANINVLIRDVIGGIDNTTDLKNNLTGEIIDLKVSSDAANAWAARNASMALSYEGLGDLLVNNVNLRVMRMPSAAIRTTLATPKNVVDTATFKVTLKTGIFDTRNVLIYNRERDGIWKAYLAERNNLGNLTAITQPIDVSANDGSAIFDGLQAQSLQGKTIVGVTVPILPGGTFSATSYKVVSDPMVINFLPGGELPATISASRTTGSTPLVVRFDVAMETSYRDDVAAIGWEYQLNGGEWIAMTGVKGFTANYTFSEGGVYNVRAIITNKNTMYITQTSPVQVISKQTLNVSLSNNVLALPGSTVTMNFSATKLDGTPTQYVTEWTLFRQNLPQEVFMDVNSLDITSATPQIVNVKVRARPIELPYDDPESWVTVSRTVQFAIPDKPRAQISGPASMEAGTPQEFTVRVVAPWSDKIETTLRVDGKWLLPDGTEIPGSEKLLWNPTPESIEYNGQIMKLKYVSWVVGSEALTTWTVEKKVTVRKYEFPNMKFSVRADTTFAPAYISLTAIPATIVDTKNMNGKKLTYTWDIPEGVVAKAVGSKLVGTIDMPGLYVISLKVSDDRGNEQVLNHSFEIAQSRPYQISMKVALAQKYNRAPAKYGIRVELTGGHPKDSIRRYALYLDDVVISENAVRPPTLVNILTPGVHTIKVQLTTGMGAVVDVSEDVEVGVNVVPTCTSTTIWESRGRYVTIKAICSDSDGVVRTYAWWVDDVLQVGKTGTTFSWAPTPEVSSAVIKFMATDDAGGTTLVEVPVNKP